MSADVISQAFVRVVITAAMLLVGGGLAAAPPGETPVAQLDAQAKAAIRKALTIGPGARRDARLRQALELFQQAERQDPHWRHSYNVARTHMELGRWIDAWIACQHARVRDIPLSDEPDLRRIEATIDEKLAKTHAFVEVAVSPADASVAMDDVIWGPGAPPGVWRGWSSTSMGTLRVAASGHTPVDQPWAHPIGQHTTRMVTLRRAPGDLVVSGTPEGAKVEVSGKVVGMLPECRVRGLEPGRYRILVTKEGFVPSELHAVVRGGETHRLEATLVAAVSMAPPFVVAAATRWPVLRPLKWSLGVAGVASLGAGAVLLGLGDKLAREQEDKNEAATPADAEYPADYDANRERHETYRNAGIGLTAAGGLLLAGAAVAFVFDALPPVLVTGLVVERGGGIVAGGRF